jgi:hypothetical protein
MAKKIVQVNFKYKVSESDLLKAFEAGAKDFVDMKGLEWKIWLAPDTAKKTAQGIYLFKDEKSANDFLKGEVFANVKKHPALNDVEAKVSDILPELTKRTRGPI